MKTHYYEPISEELFIEIKKLQEDLLHDRITLEEFKSKVSVKDLQNYRVQAQIKFES